MIYLKALLLEHADTIFECKNCRMLFRPVSHTRWVIVNDSLTVIHWLGLIQWLRTRKLNLFVEHKADCQSDIVNGLCFNGTDLGNRAGKDLKNTLNWVLPHPPLSKEIENRISIPSSSSLLDPFDLVTERDYKEENEENNEKNEAILDNKYLDSPGLELASEREDSSTPDVQPDGTAGGPAPEVVVIGSDCPVCSKTFATKNNCRRHVREMHRMSPISKVCSLTWSVLFCALNRYYL